MDRLVFVFSSPRHFVFLTCKTKTSNILNVRAKYSRFYWSLWPVWGSKLIPLDFSLLDTFCKLQLKVEIHYNMTLWYPKTGDKLCGCQILVVYENFRFH